MSLYWWNRLNEAWDEEPRSDWYVAHDHGHKPRKRVATTPSGDNSTPSYHDILVEFERRTNQHKRLPAPPPETQPTPKELFDELEKRTGQRLEDA